MQVKCPIVGVGEKEFPKVVRQDRNNAHWAALWDHSFSRWQRILPTQYPTGPSLAPLSSRGCQITMLLAFFKKQHFRTVHTVTVQLSIGTMLCRKESLPSAKCADFYIFLEESGWNYKYCSKKLANIVRRGWDKHIVQDRAAPLTNYTHTASWCCPAPPKTALSYSDHRFCFFLSNPWYKLSGTGVTTPQKIVHYYMGPIYESF